MANALDVVAWPNVGVFVLFQGAMKIAANTCAFAKLLLAKLNCITFH